MCLSDLYSQLDWISMLGCHSAYQCADGGCPCDMATSLELQNKLHYNLLYSRVSRNYISIYLLADCAVTLLRNMQTWLPVDKIHLVDCTSSLDVRRVRLGVKPVKMETDQFYIKLICFHCFLIIIKKLVRQAGKLLQRRQIAPAQS